jgi:circadian clock protein KaiB
MENSMERAATAVADRNAPAKGPVVLRLYVAGNAPNSARARANLRRLLNDVDPASYELEVIDCLEEPLRVLQDGVLVTPTLVRVEPEPLQTVVGTLSALDRVAEAIEIGGIAARAGDGGIDE